MRPKPRLLLAVAVLMASAACSGDDGDDDASPTTTATGGCPVALSVVAEAVGHRVVVDGGGRSTGACTYVSADEPTAGGRVEVATRSLDEAPFTEVLADVERRSGPTVDLGEGVVDGADRGWVVSVGRAVQLAAAAGDVLVMVAVADPLLDAEGAETAAAAIAEAVLDG